MESKASLEIKIISEVEKIWIIYDVDNNGTLDFDEIRDYLDQMAFPSLSMSMEQLYKIFQMIDSDGSGCIDKQEMILFIKRLSEHTSGGIQFRKSAEFLDYLHKKEKSQQSSSVDSSQVLRVKKEKTSSQSKKKQAAADASPTRRRYTIRHHKKCGFNNKAN